MTDHDAELHTLLATLDPHARDTLRRVLIHNQADRDAIASQLLRYRYERGDDWADIIDMLTMHPDARRRAVRVLGEIGAEGRHTRLPVAPEQIHDVEPPLSRLGDQGIGNLP